MAMVLFTQQIDNKFLSIKGTSYVYYSFTNLLVTSLRGVSRNKEKRLKKIVPGKIINLFYGLKELGYSVCGNQNETKDVS